MHSCGLKALLVTILALHDFLGDELRTGSQENSTCDSFLAPTKRHATKADVLPIQIESPLFSLPHSLPRFRKPFVTLA
jgi:hypothetical protein